jgi:Protein of unknown function (DUF4232)
LIRPTIASHRRPRPSGFAALSLLGAILIGACGNTPSPSPSLAPLPSASPSSSAAASGSPSPSAAEVACTGADVRASGGPWGGAAGSRGSDIVVENQAAAACLLPAAPAIALVDARGTVLLTTPAQAGAGPSLAPGSSAGFSLLFGNWCAQNAALPLHFRLALASAAVDIANLTIASADEFPPCNGPGQPASLSATPWQ